jgi:predicted aldo/keto reductase-like oxidoreductase
MYACNYGDRDHAVAQFNTIPENVRMQMADLDYSQAEQKCPRKISIGKLMKKALEELS